MKLLLEIDSIPLPLPPVERTQLPGIVAALGEVHPSNHGDAIGEAWLAYSGDRDVASSLRSWWRKERGLIRQASKMPNPHYLHDDQLPGARMPVGGK